MSRYDKICCAKTLKGKRCTKNKLFENGDITDFCTIHTPILCSICYESPTKNSVHKLKNCSHKFCKVCINDWLLINTSCPNCRTGIESSEKNLCYFYGKKNNKVIDINFTRYRLTDIVLEEKLQFIEYFTQLFSFNQYYTLSQWTIIMEYIESDLEINKIFSKKNTKQSLDMVMVSDITEYIKKSQELFFLETNTTIKNKMELFAIVNP